MRVFVFLALWAAVSAPAFAQGDPSQGRLNDRVTQIAKEQSLASSGAEDVKFAQNAVLFGLTEIDLGKLAAEKASSDTIRQFARKLLESQERLNAQLREMAASYRIDVPHEAKRVARLDKLSKLSGEAFDKAYVKDEMKERQRNEREFYMESLNGANLDIKDLAAKNLPVLQDQIAQLKLLEKGK